MNINDPYWSRVNLNIFPPPIKGGTLLLNPIYKSIILMGGLNLNQRIMNNNLWVLDDNGWRQEQTILPSLTFLNSSTFDVDRQNVIMFGGIKENGELSEETWLFDGLKLLQIQSLLAPTARVHSSMAYDQTRKQTILFGGEITSRNIETIDDTWIWDGTKWSEISTKPSPPNRTGASMVYDIDRQVLILFGGSTAGDYLDDTWIWDGTGWILLQPSQKPDARAYAGITYDTDLHQVVLYGGTSYYGILTDTWLWNGQNWVPLKTSNSPTEITGLSPHLFYNPFQKCVMLYSAIYDKKARAEDSSSHSEIWALSSVESFL